MHSQLGPPLLMSTHSLSRVPTISTGLRPARSEMSCAGLSGAMTGESTRPRRRTQAMAQYEDGRGGSGWGTGRG